MKDSLIMLDTNICIYLINQKPPQVLAKFSTLPAGSVAISSITGAELSFGVAKSGSKRNVLALEKFLITDFAFRSGRHADLRKLTSWVGAQRHADWPDGSIDCSARAGAGCLFGNEQYQGICARAETAVGELGLSPLAPHSSSHPSCGRLLEITQTSSQQKPHLSRAG
jgi:hypothetical protein